MVFMLLDPEDAFEGEVEDIPAETCVTLRFCGSHADAPVQYQKLAAFIADHNLQIAGFSKEITMIDYEITIPAEVDLTTTNNIITISVYSLNLEPEKVLALMVASASLTHSSGEKVDIELYVNGVLKDNVIAGFTESGSVDINVSIPETAPAGSYTGHIVFGIDTVIFDDPGLTE